MEKNIWDNLKLSEENLKTVYDYLLPQADNLNKITKGELLMEIEVISSQIVNSTNYVYLYVVHIQSPRLGGFRKKIFRVIEYSEVGRFPVAIVNYFDESVIPNVDESKFLDTVQKVLADPSIQNAIEHLYRQSIEVKKSTNL